MLPRVEIFCPCYEKDEPEESHNLSGAEELDKASSVPSSLWEPYTRHGLEWLYYCTSCQAIRCRRCVEEEVVCRYCPSCLFEVTSSMARTDSNKCMRNCFQCPKCEATAIVKAVKSSGQQHSTNSQYEIACTFCDWSSGSTGLILNKQHSVGSQVNKSTLRPDAPLNSRFDSLKQYYFSKSAEEVSSTYLPSHSHSSFSGYVQAQILENKRRKSNVETSIDVKVLGDVEDNWKRSSNMLLDLAYSGYRHHSFPLLRSLRSKKTRRCKACRLILASPDPKPTSTKFKINIMAM